jgi:hypothetical protein
MDYHRQTKFSLLQHCNNLFDRNPFLYSWQISSSIVGKSTEKLSQKIDHFCRVTSEDLEATESMGEQT